LSEFKRATQHTEGDAIKATARLPGVDIEIVHRRSPAGDAEQISINLQAVPSFEAFGRFLDTAANPFAFWAAATRLAFVPWLEATRALMLPWSVAPPLPKAGSQTVSRSLEERNSD